jgi:hypothetical protein
VRVRKLLAVSVVGLVVFVAACQPTKPPPPPPPPPENVDRDVLLLGDSVGFGVGCMLGDNGPDNDQNCPAKPGFSTLNGYIGACAVAEGLVQLYGFDKGAIEGNCNGPNHYNPLWGQAVDSVTPDLVVIVTGGWEIVNRWDENNFPSGPNCSPSSIFFCAAPDRQMGHPTNPTLVTNAVENYKAQMTAAINLIRSRPSAPKVLLLNSPYVAPVTADPSNVWYEAYPATQPGNWASSNTNAPYASSKVKIDNFNTAVQQVAAGFNPADVQLFDFWVEFSPGGEFSMDLCPYPNNKNLTSTCPGQAFPARLADAGHLTTAGNNLLGCYLLPEVYAMLGVTQPDPC